MQNESKNAVGCAACTFRRECGGVPGEPALWGCFTTCLTCDPKFCDLTCPNNHRLFAARLAEIDGDFTMPTGVLTVPVRPLPLYVPKIHNGSSRKHLLSVKTAAIPVRALLQKSGTDVTGRFESSSHVRRFFRISTQTPFIITCISTDDDVELVWSGLRFGRLAKELSKLNPSAVIVPNFSFFIDDVPQTHKLYNRKRICLAAHILSDAGCRVIVPLSALTPIDWDFWYALLQENPNMTHIAKEFQTGLSGEPAARRAIDQLSKLQDRVGRPLHPVAVGGGQYGRHLSAHFERHTILDSRPFILSHKRQRIARTDSGEYVELSSPTPPGQSVDELMRWNLKEHSGRYDTGN